MIHPAKMLLSNVNAAKRQPVILSSTEMIKGESSKRAASILY